MKYLICGNYGVGNVGDECIALGIKNLLTQDNNSVVEVMGKGMLLPVGMRSFLKSLIFTRLWSRPLSKIRECDHFIVGGGGLFTDEERSLTGFFWAMHGLVASVFMRKPVTLLGVSFGPMGIVSRLATRALCSVAQKVYCRDEYSVSIAKKLGAHAVLSPDMAVYSNVVSRGVDDLENSDDKYIYFILRDYKNIPNYTITNFVQLGEHIESKFGFKIALIDFQDDLKNDRSMMSKISIQFRGKNKISVHGIKNNISNLDRYLRNAYFIFSMRFHGGIFSLIAGVPFISINYMSKSSNFWRNKGITTVPFSDFSHSKFDVSQFDSVINSLSYRKHVKEVSSEYRRFSEEFRATFSLA